MNIDIENLLALILKSLLDEGYDIYSDESIVRGVSSQAVIARERKILRKLRLNSSLRELYGEFKLHYNKIEI